MALAILMLQAFAVERGAPRGAAEHEAACLNITRCPSQIADALEAEHRVINVERNHVDAVIRISAGGGDP